MASSISAVTVGPYYKFTDCCTGEVFNFRGTITGFANNSVYTSSITSGGLITGRCYTVIQLTTQDSVFWNSLPIITTGDVSRQGTNCTDAALGGKCAPCEEPCGECPEGYTQEGDQCVKEETVPATYTGGLMTLTAGQNVSSYNNAGIRLYDDISSYTLPIVGSGTSNATFDVKAANGTGVSIPQLANVQSTLWGCSSIAACSTGSSGGRLNIAGLWTNGYPDDTELCFEFCVEIAATKQYIVGIAGDNSVKFYIDGIPTVILNGTSSVTRPFNHWHAFPITLTAGKHTIRLCGINDNGQAAFAAEVYDISLATFQSTLLNPAVGSGNCGNTPTDIAPYVIFSTLNYIGQQIPNPSQPGVWQCPDGSTPDYCTGIPQCTIQEKTALPVCPCYLLLPCAEGQLPIISSTTELSAYVNDYVAITTDDIDDPFCVYVVDYEGEEVCETAEEVYIENNVACPCPPQCYYISSAQGIVYVNGANGIEELTASETFPYVKLCSNTYPLVSNTQQNYEIISLGDCVNGVCPTLCFKLTNCQNPNLVIYSNSDSLLPYLYGSNNVVEIIGRTGCWEVSLPVGNCDCLLVDVTSLNPNFFTPFTATANSIGVYNGNTLYSFVNDGTTYYIWKNEKDQWIFTADDYGDDSQDYTTIAITSETLETCPISVDETIKWGGRIEGVDVNTDLCPAECDCPIDVTVTSSYSTCIECVGAIAYKLTACDNSDVIYTNDDLEDYLGQVVRLNCGCYTIQKITIDPPNPQSVIIEDTYKSCTECTRTYWKLTDCAGEAAPVITYTDISEYEGRVIKIKNCTECWEVSITNEHLNATTVTVTNDYDDCIECGVPTTCECTKITNLNPEPKTYFYYDCLNILQELTLASGQSSDKVCALEWLTESPYCKCIQFKLRGESYYAFIIPGETLNDRPVYNICTYGDDSECGIVYWDGSNWVIESEGGIVFWILPTSTSSLCPYGDWQEYEKVKPREKAAADTQLTSQPCEDVETCDCFTLTTSEGETFTFYPLTIDIYGNPVYTTSDGRIISYEPKNFCWRFDVFLDFNYFFCQDLYVSCPIGNWFAPDTPFTAVSQLCPNDNEFTVYDHFETFGECKNGVCPPPVFKNNRTVKPGYNTPNCNADRYDEITCKFADVMYKVVLEKRYGITNCCPDDDEKWILLKELIDLQALHDPNYKCPDCLCPCDSGKTYSTCNCGN
jgi:hypothetical protein